MKVINFIGGPGIGKSYQAKAISNVFADYGLTVELVTEYAKDLTWGEDFDTLSDQLYVTAKQNRKLTRLKNKVDVVVSDCALIFGVQYMPADYISGTYAPMVYELFNSYDNLNIFLERGERPYNPRGRTQTEEQAREIDNTIKGILDDHEIPYVTLPSDSDSIREFFKEYIEENIDTLRRV